MPSCIKHPPKLKYEQVGALSFRRSNRHVRKIRPEIFWTLNYQFYAVIFHVRAFRIRPSSADFEQQQAVSVSFRINSTWPDTGIFPYQMTQFIDWWFMRSQRAERSQRVKLWRILGFKGCFWRVVSREGQVQVWLMIKGGKSFRQSERISL